MRIKITVLALMLTFLTACSSTNETDQGFINNGLPDASVDGYNVYGGNVINGYEKTAPYNPSSQTFINDGTAFAENTIYFMFDSSEVRPQFIPTIKKYINYLRANPDEIILLEGHADERGSREYNIALGEERAISVARIMEAGGVFRGQLEFVSYGEEKPASLGHNEAAWRLNRRVHLIYQRN
jgi:peptidoglycan-associated lipoprotein